MAAANKPGWPHYAFIFSLVLALFLGIMFYLTNKEYGERIAEFDKAKADAAAATKTAQAALEQIDALKKLVGHTYDEVGGADPNKPNTVVNAATTEINGAAPDVAEKTYTAAVTKLTGEVRNKETERKDLETKLEQLQKEYTGLEDKYKAVVQERSAAQTQAETDLTEANTTKSEALAAKDKDIEDLKKAYTDSQAEFDVYKETAEKAKKDAENRIKNLVSINTKLNDRIADLEKTSFEVPDGFIRWVDNGTKTVYINLGEADRLPIRATFSVYDQANAGVARGKQDVKGAIEVTKWLGPHMAEATILSSDLYNPMAPGDQIYTPLWSPGRPEQFAVIGIFDLDKDGTPDRERLHEMVESVGAKIAIEVDQDGNRTGGEITEQIKFFVRGKIPDLADAVDVDDQKKIERLNEELTKLLNEAREHGVRVVSQSDFLTYVGYKPQQRVYRPGDNVPYNLKAGSRSSSADTSREGLGTNRESAGKTADVYSGDRKIKNKSSTGQTSKLFRGN